MAHTRPDPADERAKEAIRVRLAVRADSTELLGVLAQDEAVTVRAAVALNPALATSAHEHLVSDRDERVRMLLAGKVARLLPSLSRDQNEAALAHVHTLLRRLADDAALRVRVALTDALREMPDAPRDVIIRLAYDSEHAVSDPVLRFSPLLTDADLLELVATPSHARAAQSVASRAGLSAEVSEGIVRHADTEAVTALLSNRSATIQEATLDALAGRAGDHPEWHEPLLRRPSLPPGALASLSRLVAGNLLQMLIARPDLPVSLASELEARISRSLEAAPTALLDPAPLDRTRRTCANPDEGRLLDAAAAGDHRVATAILAASSGVPVGLVNRAIALRSAKGLVSLVWKAGFSMHAALVIQSFLGRLSAEEIVHSKPDIGFPLSRTEMEWQIELLDEPAR